MTPEDIRNAIDNKKKFILRCGLGVTELRFDNSGSEYPLRGRVGNNKGELSWDASGKWKRNTGSAHIVKEPLDSK